MEQRRYPRVTTLLPVYWGRTPECPLGGRITSLSIGGCFIQTEKGARTGDLLFLRMRLSDEGEHIITCNARYHMEGVGIGVAFQNLLADDEWRQLIGSCDTRPPAVQ